MASSLLSPKDDDAVGLYFVIPVNLEHSDCDKDMQEAYQNSLKSDLNPSWKTEESCLTLTPTKRNVFVFQEFSGAAFDHLRKFKCVSITGPRFFNHCLTMKEQMPLVAHPTFTAAMEGLVITCTGGGVELKKETQEKVELMAGTYLKNFTPRTTHVVVSSVRSTKYEKAMELGIPVRTYEWVKAVWKRSLKEYIIATDPIFDIYKCPPFLDLKVCSSGISIKETERLKNTIIKHGGTYDSSLSKVINVLVVKHPKGDKYKYANSWSIPCVEPRWIYDSVQNGHALPTKSYEVNDRATSSPTSENMSTVSFAANVSNIYFDQKTHIEETLMNTSTNSVASYCPAKLSTPVKMGPPPAPKSTPVKTPVKVVATTGPSPGELKHLLKDLRLSQIKTAGSFLDGCRVYLAGWTSEEEENLKKILKCSGAARFSDLSDRVSHVLVGNLEKPFLRIMKNLSHKPHVVNIKWLIQSVTEKVPANEEPFYCLPADNLNVSEAPSPLSKKGMALLQRENISPQKSLPSFNHSVQEQGNFPPCEENPLLAKYISSGVSERETMTTSLLDMPPPPAPLPKPKSSLRSDASHDSSDGDSISNVEEKAVFKGLKFVIVGLADDAAAYVRNDLVCKFGGEVVSKTFKGVPDYAVVPLTGATLRQAATEIVTILWLESCVEQLETLPVSYYHQPVVLDENKRPLEGYVLCLSGFNGKERQFIVELASALGAFCQDVFAKKSKSNAKASSHLICKTNEKTEKLNAAIKWGRPAIYHSWLLACASSGTVVPEANHLVDPKQVIKPVENVNSTAFSVTDTPPMPNKCESPHITALRERVLPQTPERTKPLYDQAEVDRILNFVPPPDPPCYGLSDNPSPGESRRLQRWIDRLPGKLPSPPPRRDSTPLNELRRRVLEAYSVTTPEMLGIEPVKTGGINTDETPTSANSMKKQMNNTPMNCGTAESRVCPESSAQSSTTSRKLFGDVNAQKNSALESQLDKLNKLIATPEVEVAGPSVKISSANNHKFVENPEKRQRIHDGSQLYAIKWEDPVHWKRSPNVGSTSPPFVQSNINAEEGSSGKRKSSENAENPNDVKRSLLDTHRSPLKVPLKKIYKFSFSSVGEKDPYLSIITKLGGVLIDSSSYNPEATHLIVEKSPQRSEKLLAFIASGKWVLHVSYLFECEKKGKFVAEEDFEWGNPCNKLINRLKANSVEEALAKAAHRWRTSVTNNECSGAFEGFKCKIHTSDEKTVAFSRLISAGCGKALPLKSLEDPSFCLINMSSHKDVLVEYAKQGIPCLPLTFLYEHLTVYPPPKPESRALDEYKKLREKHLK